MPQVLPLLGQGTLAAIIVFILLALASGHLLGGPTADNRTVLAMMSSSRHPGVALAIAGANFPSQKLVIAAPAALPDRQCHCLAALPHVVQASSCRE